MHAAGVDDARPDVILLAGPAGAGKSTTAARIAEQPGWIHLSEDDHWTRIKVGRPPGELRTTDEEDVVQREVIDRVRDAVARREHVALELIVYEDPPRPLLRYQGAFDAAGVSYVTRILRPDVEEILRRIARRGRAIDVDPPGLRDAVEHQVGVLGSAHIEPSWVIDSSDLDVDELYVRHFERFVEPGPDDMPIERCRVDDMTRDDLASIAWSGSAAHLRNVAGQLDRRDAGVVEYLVVRDADGSPVSKGGIDYEEHPGAGSVFQVATRLDLEGRGLATMLLAEAERRIRARGLSTACLSVEPDNARARRLYEHLGYVAVGEREIGWEHELEDGTLGWYSTIVVDMQKDLRVSDSW